MTQEIMQIYLINRKTGKKFWLSQYFRLTTVYEYSYFTIDLVKVSQIIKKYRDNYKVIVVTTEGEVIKKYD